MCSQLFTDYRQPEDVPVTMAQTRYAEWISGDAKHFVNTGLSRDDRIKALMYFFEWTWAKAAKVVADNAKDEIVPDAQTRGLISSATRHLRKQEWFILENTAFGVGMFAPTREDTVHLIETLEI